MIINTQKRSPSHLYSNVQLITTWCEGRYYCRFYKIFVFCLTLVLSLWEGFEGKERVARRKGGGSEMKWILISDAMFKFQKRAQNYDYESTIGR